MTEDEAKTKVCCGARNTSGAVFGERPCVGSACTAWRWNAIVAPGMEAVAPVKLDVGFCGVAGAPQ